MIWTLRALAELGESERAERLLSALNPIRHALNADDIERYKVEPYVVAADVYSAADELGRGGWTWYTGSAGWFYRTVLEDILGFKREGKTVTLKPCLPPSWPSFELSYRFGKSTLHVVVENAQGREASQDALTVDGRTQAEGTPIPLVDDGRTHEVQLRVGERRLRSSAVTWHVSCSRSAAFGLPSPTKETSDEVGFSVARARGRRSRRASEQAARQAATRARRVTARSAEATPWTRLPGSRFPRATRRLAASLDSAVTSFGGVDAGAMMRGLRVSCPFASTQRFSAKKARPSGMYLIVQGVDLSPGAGSSQPPRCQT